MAVSIESACPNGEPSAHGLPHPVIAVLDHEAPPSWGACLVRLIAWRGREDAQAAPKRKEKECLGYRCPVSPAKEQ